MQDSPHPDVNKDEIKRIRNLKIKSHHFDNLQQSMEGMGDETIMRTVKKHYPALSGTDKRGEMIYPKKSQEKKPSWVIP